jgi:hypothetical protein
MRFCTDCTLRCLAALLLFCSYSGNQETKKNATVTILVKDVNGGVVIGAQAKFVSRKTGETKTLVVDSLGVVLELEPATYEVIVTALGFRPLKRQIILNAGEEAKIDLVLEVVCFDCDSIDYIVDPAEPMVEQEHAETKTIDIKSVELIAPQAIFSNEKPIAFKEFREPRNGRLRPSTKFDVVCEVHGELDLSTEDFFLWTTVDFLVAPVTEAYEKMNIDQTRSSVSWGQVTEMHDLKAVPIYSLRAGDTRSVVINDFDLEKTLASFPVGNAGNLWPWLLRINVHIQDRAGKQIVSVAHIVRLWPDSIRLPKN